MIPDRRLIADACYPCLSCPGVLYKNICYTSVIRDHVCNKNHVTDWENYYYPFNGLFPGQPGKAQDKKGKTSLDLNETRDNGVLGW